ncbi:MAG: MBL fold metallo-hydrolase [Dehalococcoidia bacterium]|nr:MBL fold metallo-hydrolase [Dehalococcoidia bacterium]
MTTREVAYRVTVGNVEMLAVSDGTGEFPAANAFPKATSVDWQRHPGALTADGKLQVNFGSFVLRSQGQTILVDTGLGPGRQGRLLEDLKAKGVPLDEITIVAITHLHGDHVGWNVVVEGGRHRLTFPKAKYWIPKGDWDHFLQPQQLERAPLLKTVVLPLQELGALRLVDGETAMTSEVSMAPTPGHTPGHMSVVVDSQGERGFITGDVISAPVQAQEAVWEVAFDNDREQGRRTREAVLERLEREKCLVGVGHFLPPNFGRFVRTKGRLHWQGV